MEITSQVGEYAVLFSFSFPHYVLVMGDRELQMPRSGCSLHLVLQEISSDVNKNRRESQY